MYTLSDPTTGLIRYVGKTERGLERRLREHLYEYNLRGDSPKNVWIRPLVKLNLKPLIEALEEFTSAAEMDEGEAFYVSYLRYIGADLTNTTDGGEVGFRGKHTATTKEKIGRAHRGIKKGRLHGIRTSRARGGRPILDSTGNRFETLADAARKHDVYVGQVSHVIHGRSRHAGGIVFAYEDSLPPGTLPVLRKDKRFR